MSLKIGSIESLMRELKCRQCSKLLSVPPIYYCSATGNVCGRCSISLDWMIFNGTLERATAYEAVAKHLIFPCYNSENGCNAELAWNQVEEHEKSCTLSSFMCPFNVKANGYSLQCVWKGSITNVVSHLHEGHKNNLQINPTNFIMNIHDSNVQIFYEMVAEKTFVIFTKYLKDTNKFYCVVMCCAKEPENRFYRYQLELGRYDDYFLILRKNNVEQFFNTVDIIENSDKTITVDVPSVTTMLGNPNSMIYCKIGIAKKSKKEINAIMDELKLPAEIPATAANSPLVKNPITTQNPPSVTKNPPSVPKNPPSAPKNPPIPNKNSAPTLNKPTTPPLVKNPCPQKPKLTKVNQKPNASAGEGSISNIPEKPKIVKQLSQKDKQLLEELECPVCNNHMLPPIYICPTGHSICNYCKDKLKECPSCRVEIKNTRNFTLEKFTKFVQYPCKFADLGCTEILNSDLICQHENGCGYGSNKCPLKMLPSMCNLKKDPVDIISHIREKHLDCLAEVNQEYARNIKAKITSSYYVAIHDKDIFIICCKHSVTTGPIKFNFLHVGMKQQKPKFRYELEFLDQTNKGMKFIINQLCQPALSNVSAAFKEDCLAIPLEMLVPFIANKAEPTLFFKFRIEKL